jgi:hypothetical protein
MLVYLETFFTAINYIHIDYLFTILRDIPGEFVVQARHISGEYLLAALHDTPREYLVIAVYDSLETV